MQSAGEICPGHFVKQSDTQADCRRFTDGPLGSLIQSISLGTPESRVLTLYPITHLVIPVSSAKSRPPVCLGSTREEEFTPFWPTASSFCPLRQLGWPLEGQSEQHFLLSPLHHGSVPRVGSSGPQLKFILLPM